MSIDECIYVDTIWTAWPWCCILSHELSCNIHTYIFLCIWIVRRYIVRPIFNITPGGHILSLTVTSLMSYVCGTKPARPYFPTSMHPYYCLCGTNIYYLCRTDNHCYKPPHKHTEWNIAKSGDTNINRTIICDYNPESLLNVVILIQSLQLNWWPSIRRWNLQVPAHQSPAVTTKW